MQICLSSLQYDLTSSLPRHVSRECGNRSAKSTQPLTMNLHINCTCKITHKRLLLEFYQGVAWYCTCDLWARPDVVTFDVTVKATSNDPLNLDMNFHWSRKAGRGQGEGSSRFEPESGLSSLYELRTTSEGTRSLDGSVHVRVAVVLNDDGDGGAAAWSAIAARLLLLSLRLLARSSQIRIYNESWETEDRCSSAS